jgi:hypothetical protein
MFFSGLRLLDRSIKFLPRRYMFREPGTCLNKNSQNRQSDDTCCSVFSLANHTLSIYSKKKRYDDYHVVRSFVWHKYNMRSEYMYQKLESPEACSGFVRSLNNGLMSI